MSEVFLKIVNMSISASWIVLAVLLLRLLLKKAPKWIMVLLWGVVGIRLVLPVSIESAISLIPSAETVNPSVLIYEAEINTGFEAVDNVVNPVISEAVTTIGPEKVVSTFKLLILIFSKVWLIGIAILFVYAFISYWRVCRKVSTAVLLRDHVYQSEAVSSPFVLGVVKPKIYLPFHMRKEDEELVIAHEEAHLKRKDHLWKPLGFVLLTLHWFNPLMWLGYILLCRDIEIACDEKVVKELTSDQRADYSQALLTCSVNRRMIAACPLAFGEVGIKERVKSVLNYKKPAWGILIVGIIVIVVAAVCFLTNPYSERLKNIEFLSLENQVESTERVYITSDGESYHSVGAVSKDLLQELLDLKISKHEVSRNRGEDRDTSHTLVLQTKTNTENITASYIDGLYIYFNSDFTEVWVNNSVKPTLSYKVSQPQKAKEIYESINNFKGSDSDTDISSDTIYYRFKWEKDSASLSLSTTENIGSFSYSILSSYFAHGTYEDDGTYIILKTDDGQYEYTFEKEGDSMRFVASKSSVLPRYAYSAGAKAQVCVPDGAVFEQVE